MGKIVTSNLQSTFHPLATIQQASFVVCTLSLHGCVCVAASIVSNNKQDFTKCPALPIGKEEQAKQHVTSSGCVLLLLLLLWLALQDMQCTASCVLSCALSDVDLDAKDANAIGVCIRECLRWHPSKLSRRCSISNRKMMLLVF